MRKEVVVTITAEGRDKGKVFVIREKSAVQTEKWATRALLALSRSGVDIGDAADAGIRGIMALGIKALFGMSFTDAEPLLDEMMECVSWRVDPKRPDVTRPLMVDDDIEEVATLLRLRSEVVELHTGFSIAGLLSTSTSETPAAASPNIPMSPASSASSSHRARRATAT